MESGITYLIEIKPRIPPQSEMISGITLPIEMESVTLHPTGPRSEGAADATNEDEPDDRGGAPEATARTEEGTGAL